MKKIAKGPMMALAALALMVSMVPAAFAAEPVAPSEEPIAAPAVCYPTAVSKSDDFTQVKKMYDLSPEDDPAGIPRSDFEQDGFHYTMVELLKQEMPEHESRLTTETVSIASKSKDMSAVLSLLPQEREFVTDDGLSGVLTLKLDSVDIKVAGYGTATKELSATRSYPNLASQDTSVVPKEIEDNGHTLTLQSIDWKTEGYNADGAEHFTAYAVYGGSTTSSYVKGYTVTADYTGTVSRINLNKVRYVAIFEGTPLKAEEPVVNEPVVDEPVADEPVAAPKKNVLPIVLSGVALAGAAGAVFIAYKRRHD